MGKSKLGRRSRLFRDILNGVEPNEMLFGAIDVAKYQPKAGIFEYFGDIIIDPFFFTPDYRGIEEVCANAEKALAMTGKKKVVFGVENTGHYQDAIIKLLKSKGHTVLAINAATTSQERKSLLDYSKTDDIDLHAIALAITSGKVTFNQLPTGIKGELLYLTRIRRILVQERAKALVMMRNILDHFWPYIQGVPEIIDGKPTLHKPFDDLQTKTFLEFMTLVPMPSVALAFGEDGLHQLSLEHHLQLGQERIKLILQSARLAEPLEEAMLKHYVYHTGFEVDNIRRLNKEIESLEKQIESLFVRTAGVLLLSIPQIGVTTGAEYMAEVGLDLERYHSSSAIIKLAGTNPVPNSSAGHSGQMCISKQGNPWLRATVTQIGRNLIERGGNPYFTAFVQHLSCRFVKQRNVAAGNKFIRVSYAMLKKGQLFKPETWTGESLTANPLSKLRAENVVTAQETLNLILR